VNDDAPVPESTRFERHGELGRGASASVFLAHDHERGHVVALKVLHPHLVGDPSARRRLEREVRTSALVQHEAALVPYGLHELPEGTALSMPFHPGETLAARIADRGPLAPEDVRVLGKRLAAALVVAHRAGVLHRDLSPNNILLTGASDAVLTDFGLARVGESHTATATGMLGTVGYAAPELVEGQRGDPRSDLYALGGVLYLALTGQAPFPGASPVASLRAQLEGNCRPVLEVVPSCPKDLARTVEALLEADPARRPQGAPDVVDLLSGRIPVAAPPPRKAVAVDAPAMVATTGPWRVVVTERSGDRERRKALRVAAKQTPSQRRWSEVGQAIGRKLEEGIRNLVGLDPGAAPSPEDELAGTVREHGFDVDGSMLLERTFVLVQGVDEATAKALVARAVELGFDAEALLPEAENAGVPAWADASWIWILATFLFVFAEFDWWIFLVAFALVPAAQGVRKSTRRPDATSTATAAATARSASEAAPAVEPSARPADVGDRAQASLVALAAALQTAEVPDIARRDLLATHAELSGLAEAATRALRVPEQAPAGLDAEVAQLERRRTRLRALESAGQTASTEERVGVEQALVARRGALLAADRAEGERVAAMAHLVEIASTADRVRYEVAAGPRAEVGEATERLRREASALRAARQELARQGGT